jgi:hypothetical protein
MPQPIHFSRPIHFDFSAPSILQRPDLARYIGVISNTWNELDARIAVFLATLLDAEATTVITIFTDLKSDIAKRSVINSVVSLKLDADDRKTFEQILISISKRYEERNRVIHGAWGISPEYPNGLLWCDIRETTVLAAELMELSVAGDTVAQHAAMLRQQSRIFVYTENDFIDMFNRITDAYLELDVFVKPFIAKAFGPAFGSGLRSHLTRK